MKTVFSHNSSNHIYIPLMKKPTIGNTIYSSIHIEIVDETKNRNEKVGDDRKLG